MKTFVLSIILSLLSLTVSAADLILTNVQYKTRFELITNWCLFTNSFDAHYGYAEGTNHVFDETKTMYQDYPSAYIGYVKSNNIVDIYNNNVYVNSSLISSKSILKITIDWHTNVVYGTNYETMTLQTVQR